MQESRKGNHAVPAAAYGLQQSMEDINATNVVIFSLFNMVHRILALENNDYFLGSTTQMDKDEERGSLMTVSPEGRESLRSYVVHVT